MTRGLGLTTACLKGVVVLHSGPSDAETLGHLCFHAESLLDMGFPSMGCDLGQGSSLQPCKDGHPKGIDISLTFWMPSLSLKQNLRDASWCPAQKAYLHLKK